MKKQKLITSSLLFITLILGLAAMTVFGRTNPVAAACTTPSTNYGTATMQISIPTAGNYRIWTHMLAPNANGDSYLLEIDGGACYVVGDGGVATNAWTWVDHQSGNTASKITVNLTAGTHTFKAIGREPSLKFDRIIAASDQNCIPNGNGDNCMVQDGDTTKPTVTLTQPVDLSTIKGTVTMKVDAADASGISKVEFYVQDVLKSTDTTAPYEYPWDTTTGGDGAYTVMAKAFDTVGNTSFDANSVTVKNSVVTAPPAPVAVTASAPLPTRVVVQWRPGGGAAADLRYRIIRNNVTIATVTGTSYTDNGVVAGTKYNYHVVAIDKNNNTSPLPANPVSVTTPNAPTTDTQKPSKPTKVATQVVSSHQINLSWHPSADNVGVKNYDIYRSQSGAKAVKIATVASRSYGNTGLFSNMSYTYYIVARDAAGNVSPASDRVTATTYAMPFTSTLQGTVKSSSGRPVVGAKVALWADGRRFQATTNWRGQYRISRLPAGVYQVQVKASGYKSTSITVKLSDGKTKWLDVTLRR